MAEITVFIDDSAEQKRRKRQRWLELALVLALLPVLPVVSARRPAVATQVPVMTSTTATTNTTTRTDTTSATSTDTVSTTTTADTTDTPVVVHERPQPLAVTPAAIHFNARGLPPQIITIKNSERVTLKPSGNDFLITDNCNDGPPCVAAVVFAPTSEGRRDGELRVIGNHRVKVVRLSGFTPVTPPPPPPPKPRCADNLQPAIDPPNVHFAGTGRRTITFSNPHSCAIRIDAINLMNADQPNRKASGYKLINDANCKRVLQPGERCSFDVATSPWHFTPRATIDVRSTVVTP